MRTMTISDIKHEILVDGTRWTLRTSRIPDETGDTPRCKGMARSEYMTKDGMHIPILPANASFQAGASLPVND
jgi:hypothetical protein